MNKLEATQVEANIAKLMAEAVKLNTETESLKFRDQLEVVKVFLYGFVTAGVMIGAIAQVLKYT